MAYIYGADLWCDSCGADIARGKTGRGEPDTGESDTFPQDIGDPGESDSPCHCGAGRDCLEAIVLSDGHSVGALLSTALTSEGVAYVREAIAADRQGEEPGVTASVALEVWADAFYLEPEGIYCPESEGL